MVRVRVTNVDPGAQPLLWQKPGLEFWKKWTFTAPIHQGKYLVEIWIRECLAYRAKAILTDDPF